MLLLFDMFSKMFEFLFCFREFFFQFFFIDILSMLIIDDILAQMRKIDILQINFIKKYFPRNCSIRKRNDNTRSI
ncbi:hypothetical protein CQC18_07870 [Salmonella enterica]|nr:hypothetical protein [Salmonella enterica]